MYRTALHGSKNGAAHGAVIVYYSGKFNGCITKMYCTALHGCKNGAAHGAVIAYYSAKSNRREVFILIRVSFRRASDQCKRALSACPPAHHIKNSVFRLYYRHLPDFVLCSSRVCAMISMMQEFSITSAIILTKQCCAVCFLLPRSIDSGEDRLLKQNHDLSR